MGLNKTHDVREILLSLALAPCLIGICPDLAAKDIRQAGHILACSLWRAALERQAKSRAAPARAAEMKPCSPRRRKGRGDCLCVPGPWRFSFSFSSSSSKTEFRIQKNQPLKGRRMRGESRHAVARYRRGLETGKSSLREICLHPVLGERRDSVVSSQNSDACCMHNRDLC